MMNSIFFIVFISLFSCQLMMAQKYSGNYYGGYSGIYGIQENPASFSNNKPYWDINLVGIGASVYSQYGYIKDESILSWISKKQTINAFDSIPYTYSQSTDALLLPDSHSNSFNGFNLNAQVALPSFCFKIKTFSFGVFANSKFYTDAVSIPNFFDYHNLNALVDLKDYNVSPFSFGAMAWSEIGLHIGKRFELQNENNLSFGINFKYLLGHEAAFFENVSDFKFQKHNDSVYSARADVRGGFATGKSLNGQANNFGVQGTGYGFDIGAEYMVLSDDDSKSWHKYKFGVSINDIGAINFDKNAQVHHFKFNSLSEISNNVHRNTSNDDDILRRISTAIYGDSLASLESKTMTMYLPTSIRFNMDMNLYKNIFIHANISRRLKFSSQQLAAPNVMSISPRFEQRWFEAGMSFSIAEDKWMGVGSYIRLGVLTIGSDHIMSYFFPQSSLRGSDIYLSLKFMPLGKKNGFKAETAERFGSGGTKKENECYKF